jgi:SAM-dependent methyltransferase
MDPALDVVRRGYDRLGPAYRDWSADVSVRLTWLAKLMARLPSDSLVVDLGCGPGEPVTRTLTESHRVVGVDASHVQLLLAREAAPSAALVHADMTQLAIRPYSVDAVASFYALGHIPPERHVPLFESIGNWLRPGGWLLTSAPIGSGEDRSEWLGVPMYWGGIGPDATRQAVIQAGLILDEREIVPEDEGDGHVVKFLWLLAQKPS